MTHTIPSATDLGAWAERNSICGDYLPRIATAIGVRRKKLVCELARKLFKSWAKRRLELVEDLDDIPAFEVDQSLYQGLMLTPFLSDVQLDEQENAAIEITIAGCKRTSLGKAIERVSRNDVRQATKRQGAAPAQRRRRREIIKRYCTEHGLTLGDLARRATTNVTAIQGMVRGDRARYSGETLARFLKSIAVPPEIWADTSSDLS